MTEDEFVKLIADTVAEELERQQGVIIRKIMRSMKDAERRGLRR